MKKLVRVSMVYMIVGLLAGIFYREFTKWNDFTGETQLSVLHTHILILGMFFFLIVLFLEKNFQLSNEKNYKKFYMIYNMGLGITLLMMIVRGSLQVLDYPESAAIAGIAGLGHIIITVGLAYFFQVLFQAVKE
ncbi:DUF2871 domain-containing protein [Enterococcus plantarum]|uniref:DUF2871 domain-containing protein n=1 Tax=Enterococcus plantarum TaxID=1077675 RepID=UPI001A8F8C4B|nr:DUF2871 domain-containing protein [Enterococcus plantarum]MBO0422137.1 DUF2871 domain-containing protein [Enterococcus plantarum]